MARLKLGVLISGSGTNLQAIIDACLDGSLNAEVRVVISNHANAYGLERARHARIAAVYIDRAKFDSPKAYNRELLRVLREHQVDTVVMAGYMRLLGKEVLANYPLPRAQYPSRAAAQFPWRQRHPRRLRLRSEVHRCDRALRRRGVRSRTRSSPRKSCASRRTTPSRASRPRSTRSSTNSTRERSPTSPTSACASRAARSGSFPHREPLPRLARVACPDGSRP